MNRSWLLIIVAGLVSALMWSAVTTGALGAVAIAWFAQFPIFLAGLSLGATAGALAGGAGFVALLVTGGIAALGYLLVAVPAVIMIQRALLAQTTGDGTVEWYPLGRMVFWLTGLGVVALTVTSLFHAGEAGGLEGAVRELADLLVTAMFQPVMTEITDRQLTMMIESFASLLPAGIICFSILQTVLNGSMAQSILQRAGRSIRPAVDIVDLELPTWAPAPLAAAAVLAWIGGDMLGYYGQTLLAICAVPFFLAGLAVAHAMARHRDSRRTILAVFYGTLFFIAWPIVLLIVLLGMIEQWAHLRRRFLAQT